MVMIYPLSAIKVDSTMFAPLDCFVSKSFVNFIF